MKRYFALLLIVFVGFTLWGCSSNKSQSQKPSFKVSLVKEQDRWKALAFAEGNKGKYVTGRQIDLDSLSVENEPLFTDRDIKTYHWKTHVVEFTDEFLKKHKAAFNGKDLVASLPEGQISHLRGGSERLGTSQDDAWVLEVDGERIYSGGFPLPATSSKNGPRLGMADCVEGVMIWSFCQGFDPRANTKVRSFFQEAGKLSD